MYAELINPLILNNLDSETMHVTARRALHFAEGTALRQKLLGKFNFQRERYFNPRLEVNLMGLDFDNPGMVGAGWDKPGEAVLAWYLLGAAGTEVGTVVKNRQYGNPKPRQFVVEGGVSFNWLGFNLDQDAAGVARNLSRYQDFVTPDWWKCRCK